MIFYFGEKTHWVLGVTHDEGESRVRRYYRAENLAILYRVCKYTIGSDENKIKKICEISKSKRKNGRE